MTAPRTTAGLILEVARASPRRTTAVIVCLVAAGLTEGFGTLTLLPLLELAMAPGGAVANSSSGKAVVAAIRTLGLDPKLGVLLTLVTLGIALKAGFTLIAMRQVGYTVSALMTDLRLRLLRALLQAKWSYFTRQPVGVISNAISTETVRAAMVFQSTAQFLALIIQMVIYIFLVLLVSWEIALVSVALAAAITWAYRGLIAMMRSAGNAQTDLMSALSARMTDTLHGIKAIKAMALEGRVLPVLEAGAQGLNKAQRQQVWSGELLRNLQEPLLVAVMCVGLYLAIGDGGHTFPSLMMMAFLFYRLLNRVHAVQQIFQVIAAGESAYWALQDSVCKAESQKERGRESGAVQFSFKQSLKFEHVSFAYGDNTVLDDINFCLDAGRFVVMFGKSGAGKTTIADLAIGLLTPTAGRITIDGISIETVNLNAWREQIGYVPQEMFLFHDSVLMNITFGAPDITLDAVEAALKSAGAWGFVQQLSEGVNTVVGERGSQLSGGQRQRIAIARALVRNPSLLVLDEVTASLDTQSEQDICATLRSLAGKVSILAISHQPAIKHVADIVVELQDGRIIH